MPFAGVIRNLVVESSYNTIPANTVVSIYKNGVITAVTLTIGSEGVGIYSDLTHSVSVAVGDKICVGLDAGSTGTYDMNFAFSYEVV